MGQIPCHSDSQDARVHDLRNGRKREKEYYLIVGRFVPENNYEAIIREFMKSKTQRDSA